MAIRLETELAPASSTWKLMSNRGEMISSDGDGLAERPTEAEHRAADDAAAAERHGDDANHSPPC